MPELPEVETVRRGLERHVLHRRVHDVEVRREYSVRHQVGGSSELRDLLVGASLAAAVRRGKFLWFPLERAGEASASRALVAHLGMSGQLLVHRPRVPSPDRHVRVRVVLDGVDSLVLDFVDQRTFGYVCIDEMVATDDGGTGGQGSSLGVLPQRARHVARDVLDPVFDESAVVDRVLARRTGIKRALLDQALVAGVGNIYADEALWRARIHPDRVTASLRAHQVRRVLRCAREVMVAALQVGGTSFDTLYVDVEGASGYFSRSLAAYGRAGEPCLRCGTPIVREKFTNRSSHFCPVCQRQR